jgi:hypothetical protein
MPPFNSDEVALSSKFLIEPCYTRVLYMTTDVKSLQVGNYVFYVDRYSRTDNSNSYNKGPGPGLGVGLTE